MNILIINGPNLNLLGLREPGIYGTSSFEEFFTGLSKEFEDIHIGYFQSNVEGNIIDKLQECGFTYDGIILNAGGYTHTSVAIRDAVAAIKTPVIEVHISNTLTREEFRHRSVIGPVCRGCIMGFGLQSYRLALLCFLNK